MINSKISAKLLVISRDSKVLRVAWTAAESNLWQLEIAPSVSDAMEKLQSDLMVDVLLADLQPDSDESAHCLSWLRRLCPAVPVVLMDRSQAVGQKLRSVQVESIDYLVSPPAVLQLQSAVEHSLFSMTGLSGNVSRIGLQPSDNGWLFVGSHPKMHRLRAQVSLLAETGLPVIISGEPGSGKDTIAHLLHQLSSRSACAFAKVDCAALSWELLEKEIFGWKGPGWLASNPKGTLFLNEIEEMPPQLQSRLAAAMESGWFSGQGSSQPVDGNLRVVAASSLSLDRAVAENRMVPELSRQFGAREIQMPPLRELKDELPLLARHFMHQLSRQFDLAAREISLATEEVWQALPWPGNLRELRQAVKRYLIVGETGLCECEPAPDRNPPDRAVPNPVTHDAVRRAGLPEPRSANLRVSPTLGTVIDVEECKSLRSMVRSVREDAERAAIASALERTGWNRKAAARLLKISYRSILYKIEQYQMPSPDQSASVGSPLTAPGDVTARKSDRKAALTAIVQRAVHGTP